MGVGTKKILGRVHAGDIALYPEGLGENASPSILLHLAASFTVLEGDDGPDLILGLDMLRRFQVVINHSTLTF